MKEPSLDQTARLFYEALQERGWSHDARKVAELVERLSLGLSAEDEFSLLISWLGNCRLVHKLDGLQAPPDSKANYLVPDLLAVFSYEGRTIPVLIEVKTSKDNALKWTPSYYENLRRYSEQLGLPLLIAWKRYDWWAFFDSTHFKQEHQNYKITFENAMKENLLGLLAGDFFFKLKGGVGFHFVFEKIEKLEEVDTGDKTEQQWLMRIKDAYFTDGAKMRRSDIAIGSGLSMLFFSVPQEEVQLFEENTVYVSFVVPDDGPMQTTYHSMLTLLNSSENEPTPIHWRQVLSEFNIPTKASILREAAAEGLSQSFVRYIIDQVPHTTPEFLKTA